MNQTAIFFISAFAGLNTILRIILALIVVIMRWKRDQELVELYKEIFSLYLKYFIRYQNIPRDTKLYKLWTFNALLLILHTLNLLAYVYFVATIDNLYLMIEVIFMYSLVGMQHLIMLHHAAILCYIFECFSLLNYQLQCEDFNCNLFVVYFLLGKLLKQVNRIYALILFFLQLCFLVAISIILFSFAIITLSNGLSQEPLIFSLSVSYCILFLIHIFVYHFICDQVCQLNWKTNIILLRLTAKEHNNKMVEELSLKCALVTTTVNVYGLFKINLAFLFVISAQIFQYIILLLQIYMQAEISYAISN
ncbi:hypothetical protein CVS40_5545 [Lucilia cuprina]|nr:hypothetical protein CVS40_5545 [Lucilia cuprina]